ncbi:DUF6894 family protein [Enterovirga rhinocerotis]|uniref:DUF6894 family protein n=1 Tax=Enterovirga rhinocerotis TaxID=1339210 RepID=UPI00105E75B5|nr:hypothetical protein [Enterovirga rhinocerotis]
MGSYFFDVRYGAHFHPDQDGVEEEDDQAAVERAVSLLAGQIANRRSALDGSLAVEVRREKDRVATVSISISKWPGDR